MTKFNPDIGDLFQGRFLKVLVTDPEGGTTMVGGTHVGNIVLDPSEAFNVEIEWELDGVNVPLWVGNVHTDENWRVNIFAESIGPGPEFVLYSGTEPANNAAVGNNVVYSHTATIAANTIDEHVPDGQAGVYKLVVTAFLNNTSSSGLDVIGFNDDNVIMVENPE